MGRWRVFRASIVIAFALSVAARASADEPTVVRVVVPPCDASAFDTEAFAHAVTLELRADGVEKVEVVADSAAPASGAVATIRLDADPCTEAAQALELTIVDEVTSKTVKRRLTVDDLARGARPRVLALAAAELLRASWSELRIADAPKGAVPVPPSVRLASMDPQQTQQAHEASATAGTPSGPSPSAEPLARATPVESQPFLRADAQFAARFFPTYGSTLIGPSVAASLGATTRVPVRVRVDAAALFGTSYDPLGSISVDLVAGGVSAVLARHAGPLDIEVGPRLELGWGYVAGSAANVTTKAASGSTIIVDASVLFALRISLGGAYSASLTGDVGGVLHSLDAAADGRRAAGFGGPVVGVAIGVGRSF
jgi:hypothetical protein